MMTDEPTTSPADVTAAWITERMTEFEIKNPRQLALASGVSYVPLTKWLSGSLPVSSEGRGVLYWYFKYKDVERQLQEIE